MALIFSSSKDMTHNRVLQCLSVNGNYLKLPFSGVFVCVCGQDGPGAGVVSKWQQWWQLSSVQGWCLGQQCNAGIALVVGWLVVGTQWVLPPATRLSASQIWRCDRQ